MHLIFCLYYVVSLIYFVFGILCKKVLFIKVHTVNLLVLSNRLLITFYTFSILPSVSYTREDLKYNFVILILDYAANFIFLAFNILTRRHQNIFKKTVFFFYFPLQGLKIFTKANYKPEYYFIKEKINYLLSSYCYYYITYI